MDELMLNGLFVRDSKLERMLAVLEGEPGRGAARRELILERPVPGIYDAY